MTAFAEALAAQVLVADGGMGSMVHQVSERPVRCVDEVNLLAPDLILGIHTRFIRAGARVIETNSFGANREKLAAVGLADRVAEVNGKAVKLAREARDLCGADVHVAGSIGPTGRPPRETEAEAREVRAVFREQAMALDARGVDLFCLETFPRVWELERAVEAVREVSALPIVALVTFPAGDEWADPGTVVPADAAQTFHRLAALGVAAVGTNCSLGPGEILVALARAREALGDGAVLAVQPNSGLPRMVGGRFLFPPSSPGYYAWFAREAVRLGARLIGGCCGTTPEHVAAMAQAVVGLDPVRAAARPAAAPPPVPEEAEEVRSETGELARKLAEGRFVVSLQVDPPKGTNAAGVLEACRAFRDSGRVDVVDVNSNPMARLHMDALWMSLMIEGAGMETIPHYTPRDASLMGIQAHLLGAWALGIRNVLVITGDPSVVAGEPGDRDVYQTDSIGLVRKVAELNQGVDCYGNRIGSPPRYTIGVAVNPSHEDLGQEVRRFREKVAAGAHFAMTQAFFEWTCWDRFLDLLGGPPPIPVLVAIWPLTSHKLAVRLHHEVPGIVVPQRVQDLLERAGPGARAAGFDLAREMLHEARRRAAGVYVIAPFKRPAAALELFE